MSDFGVPCVCGAGLGIRVEAANQLERESGTLFGRETKDLGKPVCRRHSLSLAASGLLHERRGGESSIGLFIIERKFRQLVATIDGRCKGSFRRTTSKS